MTKQTAARAEKFPGRLGASAWGRAGSPAPRFRIADYAVLLKPRVMSLVVFTAITGLLLAPNPPGSLSPLTGVFAILCIALGAGASGAINMWYDRDIDLHMGRTMNRPLPAGRLQPKEALIFGIALAAGSVTAMAVLVNTIAASLLALTILYYVFIYTVWLKRRTPQNIVIGGASGALPPVIGWAAATGDVGLGAVVLFTIIFLLTLLPVVIGISGAFYASAAAFLGFFFAYHMWQVWKDEDGTAARPMFFFSIVYLFLIFMAMLVDRLMFLPMFKF